MAAEMTVDPSQATIRDKGGRKRDKKGAPVPAASGREGPRPPERPASNPTAALAAALAQSPRRDHNLELFGVGIVAFALLLFLSLVSFDPADVAPVGRASSTGETANWIGPVGAHLADLLLHLLGATSYLLTVLLGLTGVVLFFNRKVALGIGQVIGFSSFAVCATMLGHLTFRGQHWRGHLPGGVFGELLGELGRSMLGSVGSQLFGWALLLISAMITTRLSLAHFVRRAGLQAGQGLHVVLASGRDATRLATERAGNMLRRAEEPLVLEEIPLPVTPQPPAELTAGPQLPPLTPLLPASMARVVTAPAARTPSTPVSRTPAAIAPPAAPVAARALEDPLDGWSFGDEPVVAAASAAGDTDWTFTGPAGQQPPSASPAAPPAAAIAPTPPRAGRRAWTGSADDVVFFDPARRTTGAATAPAAADVAEIVFSGPPQLQSDELEGDEEEDDDAVALPGTVAPPRASTGRSRADVDDEDDDDVADDELFAQPEPRTRTLPYPEPGVPAAPPARNGSSGRSPVPAAPSPPSIVRQLPVTRELPLEVVAGIENERLAGLRHQTWQLPPLTLLDYVPRQAQDVDRQALLEMAAKLEGKLSNYGVKGKVREIHPGPVVTMFEFEPGPGIRISKIANLSDDLAMSLEAVRVRIVAPIPGKGVVGIEVPSQRRETVYLKELVADAAFQKTRMRLPMCLGKDIIGFPIVRDLAKMPHLLTAGATGSGKSVLVNCMVVSLLYRYSPEDLRLLMVDPKQLEFALYEGIPHLLLPVVTDPKKAAAALKWAVAEMERRYTLLAEVGVRNLADYNKWVETQTTAVPAPAARSHRGIVVGDDEFEEPRRTPAAGPEKIPSIVVIIDEFAELMMVASKDVETSVCRLAQKARASGIHLILATQRPSVDVITGVIKANFPARIGLQVAQREDSRTILGQNGAENLLGDGDMLIMNPGAAGLTRAHGPLVTDEEIKRVCEYWKEQGTPDYDMDILAQQEKAEEEPVEEENLDEMYDMAVHVVAEARLASASMLQRRLRVGYNRAARLIEIMEREGVVGPADGARPREVLIPPPMDL